MDIECQRDFFLPGGSCYTKNATEAARNIYRLFNWAREHNVAVMSTVLRVRQSEHGPMASAPHCIEGTDGERKLVRTVLPSRINLGMRNTTDLPVRLFHDHQQVIFEKRDTDIFAHTRIERMITELPANVTFIICGAGVAKGIVQAAVGLRTRGFPVILASDAVLDIGDPLAEMSYRRMDAKGVIFAATSEIVAPKPIKVPVPFREKSHANT